MGTLSGLQQSAIEDVHRRREMCCVPDGAIVSVCGGIDPVACLNAVQRQADTLQGTPPTPAPQELGPRGQHLLVRPTAQVHLAMAWDAAHLGGPEEDLDRLACAALGGTTSGRLFTEVRQRRSLCYAVSARYAANSLQGSCILRAGTTPENAAELLEVCQAEICRMSEDLSVAEVQRARRTMIDAFVLQGESTQAIASRLASSVANRGDCPTMAERIAALEKINPEAVIEHARSWNAITPTIVAVGPSGCLPFPECDPVC
jgi:predicted Zn-dependent peptidase